MALYGGIEAGGTKFVCAAATGPGDIRAQVRIPTTTPKETLGAAIGFFRSLGLPLDAVGISCFGPLDLRDASPTWGYITTTPKPGWQNVDVAQRIAHALATPVAIDTDVNGAALAEQRWGAGQGLDDLVYLTVGTGIGGGAIVNGAPVHGLMHPEMGHMRIPHDRAIDPFDGNCPFHGDCLEGLASGHSLQERWGVPAEELPADHVAWEIEARHLAHGIVGITTVLSPQRVIVGGSVMKREQLFPLIRREALALLNGYLQVSAILDGIDTYIAPPALGDQAGVLGAIALAEAALNQIA
jgi:fructokinase